MPLQMLSIKHDLCDTCGMNQQEQTSTETVLIVNPNSCGGSTGKNGESLIIRSRIFLVKIPGLHLAKKSARY